MSEFEKNRLKAVTFETLWEKMLGDKINFQIAAALALEDLTTVFLDRNPNWKYAEEFQRLIDTEHRTPDQDSQLHRLFVTEMGITEEEYQNEMLKTYANQHDYVLIKN